MFGKTSQHVMSEIVTLELPYNVKCAEILYHIKKEIQEYTANDTKDCPAVRDR